MEKLKCELCDGFDFARTDDGSFMCQSCGCKYTLEQAKGIMSGNNNSSVPPNNTPDNQEVTTTMPNNVNISAGTSSYSGNPTNVGYNEPPRYNGQSGSTPQYNSNANTSSANTFPSNAGQSNYITNANPNDNNNAPQSAEANEQAKKIKKRLQVEFIILFIFSLVRMFLFKGEIPDALIIISGGVFFTDFFVHRKFLKENGIDFNNLLFKSSKK